MHVKVKTIFVGFSQNTLFPMVSSPWNPWISELNHHFPEIFPCPTRGHVAAHDPPKFSLSTRCSSRYWTTWSHACVTAQWSAVRPLASTASWGWPGPSWWTRNALICWIYGILWHFMGFMLVFPRKMEIS